MVRGPRGVRVRMSLWTVGVVALILAAYSLIVVLSLQEWFRQDLDRRLERDLRGARSILDEVRPAGGLEWDPDDDDADKPFDSDVLIQAYTLDGRELPGSPWPGNEDTTPAAPVPPTDGATTIVLDDGRWARAVSKIMDVGRERVRLRAVRTEEALHRRIQKLVTAMSWAAPIALIVAGAGGYFLALRALRPVAAMASRARTITAERLSERLPVANSHDELGRLATVLNELIARLDRSFDQLRRFTADASHELRTPLTALRSVGEVSLREPRSAEQYRETIGSMLEECDRLARLVDSLLALARGDGGAIRLERKRFDLVALVREVIDHLGVLAEERAIGIEQAGAPSAFVDGDRTVIRQALVNLIDNAIKYGPAERPIRCAVAESAGGVRFEVHDDGPGIPSEHQERLFDRFYRVDASRSRAAGGNGLGLAITKWAIEAHAGTIGLNSAPGEGTTFWFRLPVRTP